MNPPVIFIGSIIIAASLISCERKPLASTDSSQYREGKSGATSATIEDPKTDEPAPYSAAEKPEEKKVHE